MTFRQFQATKKSLTLSQWDELTQNPMFEDYSDDSKILCYVDGLGIADLSDTDMFKNGGKYQLILERSEFNSDDLSELEFELYKWYASELFGDSWQYLGNDYDFRQWLRTIK